MENAIEFGSPLPSVGEGSGVRGRGRGGAQALVLADESFVTHLRAS